jgi:hypothetical protein
VLTRISVRVSITKVVITIALAGATLVIEIPITALAVR